MARKGERKLFLFGRYSLALLLPKRWLTELGAKAGTIVSLEMDRARKRIVVRFGAEQPSIKSRKSADHKSSDEPDWEPIKEL
ncbi:MAG: hypothetical protein HZB70_00565 [Candidatus Berkelbacteria bacterium]|nr:MAG: hypothetical protein HZB70_00565 [Candidatus Berkelbacteria bacterium]QQG51400.1 MAG: hypothetical protein HY845_02435 [Candidatus Berkelbacteria bacterium]